MYGGKNQRLINYILGPIDPDDPDAGVYAFYISDHGATRLRTTKAGVWVCSYSC